MWRNRNVSFHTFHINFFTCGVKVRPIYLRLFSIFILSETSALIGSIERSLRRAKYIESSVYQGYPDSYFQRENSLISLRKYFVFNVNWVAIGWIVAIPLLSGLLIGRSAFEQLGSVFHFR